MSKSIKYNYILNVAKTVSGMLFPLITFAYASRVLSVDGIGKIDFVRNIVAIFIIFASLGVVTYGTREGAKARANRERLSRIVKELLTINIITTIVSYIIFFLLVIFVPKFYEYKDIFFVYGLCIGFTALGLEWLYNALEDFEYITIRYIVFQVISLVLLFLFVKEKSDYLIYTGILTFSTVGANLMNFIHSRKYVDFVFNGTISLKQHIRPILILFSNNLIGNIYLSLDSIMLGWMVSTYNVGLYSAANKMNRIVITVITSLFVVILPRASFYIKNNESDRYNDLLRKSISFVFLMTLPMACLLCLLSKEIIILLSGTDFIPAVSCSRILCFIIVLIPISTMASSQVIIPFGMEKKLLCSSIVGASVNAILNFILIPQFKENGAAVASVMAELSVAIITSYYAFKCINYSQALYKIWHYIIATIIMVIVVFPLGFLCTGIIKCVVFGLVSFLIYMLVLYLQKDELVLELIAGVKSFCIKDRK